MRAKDTRKLIGRLMEGFTPKGDEIDNMMDELEELERLAEIGAAIELHNEGKEIVTYDNDDKLAIVVCDEMLSLIEWYRRQQKEE